MAEYMKAVLETGDADLLLMALGDVARARGVELSRSFSAARSLPRESEPAGPIEGRFA